MGWIKCVRCEKLQRDFVARTFALIALVHHVLHQVSCSYETIPNAPKHYTTHQKMSLWSNGVDPMCSLRKLQREFVARTFAIIALVNPFCTEFHAVTKRSQMHPNTERHQNMSLGSNGVDQVRLLGTITT